MTEVGNLPKTLLKAFREIEYAENFMNNREIRLTDITEFVNSEDPNRMDYLEGTLRKVQERDTQSVKVEGIFSQRIFIFCTSLTTIDSKFQEDQFGKNIVEIFDVPKMAEAFREAILTSKLSSYGVQFIDRFKVTYNKGDIMSANDEFDPKLYYGDKPEMYKPERDFRFAIMLKLNKNSDCVLDKHVYLKMANPDSYAKLR